MAQRTVLPVTIANGASLSGEVNIDRLTIVGIQFPAATEGTAVTFQSLNSDGTTFSNVYDQGGTEVSITVAADRYVTIADNRLTGLGRIKVRTGTAGAPTNQSGANAVLGLVCIDRSTR